MDALKAFKKANFQWVVRLDNVWTDSAYDVPEIHQHIRDELLETLREPDEPTRRMGQFVVGAGGSGKTHLLSTMRQYAFQERIPFVLADMTDVRNFDATVLLGMVNSLLQSDGSGEPQFRTLLATILERAHVQLSPADYIRETADADAEKVLHRTRIILKALQSAFPFEFVKHQDVVRALVLLNSNHIEIQSIGYSWLQGVEIDKDILKDVQLPSSVKTPWEIVSSLSWLLAQGPTWFLTIDQLDAIVGQYYVLAQREDNDLSREERLAKRIINGIAKGLADLYDRTRNVLIVVSCLEATYDRLRDIAQRNLLERYDTPRTLSPITHPEQGARLISARLTHAYSVASYTPSYPTWPFQDAFFARTANTLPRELLMRCEEHRRACLERGEVLELGSETNAQPCADQPAHGDSRLDGLLATYRGDVNVSALFDEENEDIGFAEILLAGAELLALENPSTAERDCVVDNDFPRRGSLKPLHARIRTIHHDENGREKHYCLRGLQRSNAVAYQSRLRAAITCSGIDRDLAFRHLAIFRTAPIPGGRVTKQLTDDFVRNGGVFVHPSEDDLRTLWAVNRMREEGVDGFDEWLRAARPISTLAMMREARLAKPQAPTPDSSASQERQAPIAEAPSGARLATSDPTPKAVGRSDGSDRSVGSSRRANADPGAAISDAAVADAPTPLPDAAIPLGRRFSANQLGAPMMLSLKALRQHVAVLAGAGSGKTVFVRRLVEEAALLGVPAIVIDAANDLAQLGDRWPSPPEEGWHDGDSEKAERYFGAVDAVIWTPGLEGGNPLVLNPLPDFAAVASDPDELNEAVSMAREALEPIVAAGTSNTAKTKKGILSAALKHFAQHFEGGLPEFVELLQDLPPDASGGIGNAQKKAAEMADALLAQIQVDPMLRPSGAPLDPATLFGLGTPGATRLSIISFIGLSGLDQQQLFLNQLAMTLFAWIKRHPAPSEQPLRGLLVLDEAKDFIPSQRSSYCKNGFQRLGAQARKYGLGLVFATQHPKDIDNGIVSNCFTQVYGSANSPAAIDAIAEQLRQRGAGGVDVARLEQGKFYVHNPNEIKQATRIASSLCLSRHPASPLAPEVVKEKAIASRKRLGGD